MAGPRAQIKQILTQLGRKKDIALDDIVVLLGKYDVLNRELTDIEKRRKALLIQLKTIKEDITPLEERLKSFVGQARLSFSMLWSSFSQIMGFIQRGAAAAGAEWAEVLSLGLGVIGNVISVALASALVWAGTGPAGIVMAAMQVTNAGIATSTQTQMFAQQRAIENDRDLISEMMLGDEPF